MDFVAVTHQGKRKKKKVRFSLLQPHDNDAEGWLLLCGTLGLGVFFFFLF